MRLGMMSSCGLAIFSAKGAAIYQPSPIGLGHID